MDFPNRDRGIFQCCRCGQKFMPLDDGEPVSLTREDRDKISAYIRDGVDQTWPVWEAAKPKIQFSCHEGQNKVGVIMNIDGKQHSRGISVWQYGDEKTMKNLDSLIMGVWATLYHLMVVKLFAEGGE